MIRFALIGAGGSAIAGWLAVGVIACVVERHYRRVLS